MKIGMKKVVEVDAKTLKICMKVRDTFSGDIYDAESVRLGGQEDGYVPSFMPGEHYGDYLILDIDLETGQITNWKKPRAEDIVNFINGEAD